MLNKIHNNNSSKVVMETAFRDKYPNFRIMVNNIQLEEAPTYLNTDIYKIIKINNNKFVGIIHCGLSNIITPGKYYRIWFEQKNTCSPYLNVVLIDEDA